MSCLSWLRVDPSATVIAWISAQHEHQLYISSISWAELHRGVAKLAPSKRRNELTEWLFALNEQFGNRKLPFGAEAGEHWALMTVALESQGKPMPLRIRSFAPRLATII